MDPVKCKTNDDTMEWVFMVLLYFTFQVELLIRLVEINPCWLRREFTLEDLDLH